MCGVSTLQTALFQRLQRSTGHPTKRKRCLMRMRRRRSRIGEAAAAGETALAENAVPACGAAVEKRRALEQIAPDSRLVALRPLLLRVWYGSDWKRCEVSVLQTILVQGHVVKKSVPRVVCVASQKHICRGLPSALIAAVAAVCAFCAVLSQPQNLLTCTAGTRRTSFPPPDVSRNLDAALKIASVFQPRDLGPAHGGKSLK